MSTIEQMGASISYLRTLAKPSRLFSYGIVASGPNVSKQRMTDLILGGRLVTESVAGSRLVVVDSALTCAKAIYRRKCKGKLRQAC
jgi:hypothetical protein